MGRAEQAAGHMTDGKNRYRMPAGRAVTLDIAPDGGIDVSRPADGIDDNQSPDMWNMWTDGQVLTLRPGLRRCLEQEYGPITGVCPADGRSLLLKRISCDGQVVSEKHGAYLVTDRAVLSWDGSTVERVPTNLYYDGGWKTEYLDCKPGRCVMLATGETRDSAADSSGRLWEVRGDSVYLFGGGQFLTIAPQIFVWPVSLSQTEVTAEYTASCRTPYVPTVTTDTTPLGAGKAGEARNLLTTRVCQSYTADSVSTVYRMTGGTLGPDEVKVSYDDPVAGKSYLFWFTQGILTDVEGDIAATLDRAAGTMTFSRAPVGKAGVTDNLRIEYARADQTEAPVYFCTAGSWFGGASGQGGGNRIFLSGNPDTRSLVYYCAPDNPAYFPEDAVIAVGEPTDPVTGFGRQFNILVILKEHSVYSLAAAGEGGFSVSLVHSGNGCDMPGSVQRIGNVLVWANSREGLFLLHSTQIKDERTAAGISLNIGPLLREQGGSLQAACSADDGRNYYLFTGSRVFVWQYGDLEAKNGQMNQEETRYRFAVWDLPAAVGAAFTFDGAVMAAGAAGAVSRLDETAGDDDGVWFDAGWRSKAFDCGAPERGKCLTGLWLRLCADGPLRVEIGCGEWGDEEAAAVEIPVEPQDAGAVRVPMPAVRARNLQVTVRRCRNDWGRFGLTGLRLRALPGETV